MLARQPGKRAIVETVERRVLLSAITGQVYNDVNANQAKDPAEPGLGGWTVYLDQNNNGVFDSDLATSLVAPTLIPRPIPDPGTLDSTLEARGMSGAVTHVALTFNITHSFDSDLQLTLVSPAGTMVRLVDQVGVGGQNFINTTLDDTSTILIDDGIPPFTGVYKPQSPLSAFDGENANGRWTLRVSDLSGGDSGTLNSWYLSITTGEPNTQSDGNGAYAFQDLPAGTYNVREVRQAGWTQTQPPGNGSDPVILDGANTATGIDLGNHQPPGTLSGLVYNDLNGSGDIDTGEPGLPGRIVYIDTNNNGRLDSGEPSTATDAAGAWSLPAPVGTTYVVRQVQQPDWVQTDPAVGLSVGANLNVSREAGNQAEGAIAANPTNPNQLFMASNEGAAAALFVAYSSDGGATWTSRRAANGSDLPAACCDPSVSWDSFGNLFLSYIDSSLSKVVLARSSDGGRTFSLVQQFVGGVDQPTTTTGAGSLWITWTQDGNLVATGATVTGLGAVSPFGPLERVNGPAGSFGDIAVGPQGQVLLTYQDNANGEGPSTLYADLDPDGTGPLGFQQAMIIGRTNVGGFDHIPPQSARSVDAEVGLAWDRTHGPYAGRVYLVYTDESPFTGSGNTEVDLRTSDDDGATWTAPVRVNDDTTFAAQFLPRIALDQTTGNIALSWYDARNDLGAGGPGDTDGHPNDDVQLYATVSTDGGETFLPNVRVSSGTTNAANAHSGIDLGDYAGLAFEAGNFYPLWSDNGNSTGDNPDGAVKALDMYVARVGLIAGTPSGGFYSVFAGPGVDELGLYFGNRLASVPGDTNGDGRVNFSDLLVVAQNYGRTTGQGPAAGDFNRDGGVDFFDLLVLAQNYGKSPAAAADPGATLADALTAQYKRAKPIRARAYDGLHTLHRAPNPRLSRSWHVQPFGAEAGVVGE